MNLVGSSMSPFAFQVNFPAAGHVNISAANKLAYASEFIACLL
jgi:hypothetical protein